MMIRGGRAAEFSSISAGFYSRRQARQSAPFGTVRPVRTRLSAVRPYSGEIIPHPREAVNA